MYSYMKFSTGVTYEMSGRKGEFAKIDPVTVILYGGT